jgi:hypothetical protein
LIELPDFRVVDGPEAEALADAGAELMDMRFVDAALTELLDSWPPGADTGPDTTAARALWIAAVVWYARSFTTGLRTSGIAAEIASTLPDPSRAEHDYFVALRDRHMAHSVNVFEQVATAVLLGPGPDFDLADVQPIGLVMELPTRLRAERLRALARELMDLMQPRLRELGLRVGLAVTAMSPAERVALRRAAFSPPLTTTDPAAKRARQRRPRRAVPDGG